MAPLLMWPPSPQFCCFALPGPRSPKNRARAQSPRLEGLHPFPHSSGTAPQPKAAASPAPKPKSAAIAKRPAPGLTPRVTRPSVAAGVAPKLGASAAAPQPSQWHGQPAPVHYTSSMRASASGHVPGQPHVSGHPAALPSSYGQHPSMPPGGYHSYHQTTSTLHHPPGHGVPTSYTSSQRQFPPRY